MVSPVISVSDVIEGERDGFAKFTVRLNAKSASTVKVSYDDTNETAVNGSDYNAVSGTLSFAPGQTVQTVRNRSSMISRPSRRKIFCSTCSVRPTR